METKERLSVRLYCAIAVTPKTLQTLTPFCTATQTTLWIPRKLEAVAEPFRVAGLQLQPYDASLKDTLASLWGQYRGFVFGLATGAVVRLIAPLLSDKSADPAVVVVDEAGTFAISLCGGHQGGADRLATEVSHYLNATAVITGAAAHHRLPGIDVLGSPFGWRKGSGDWTGVSAALAVQKPVQVIQEAGSRLWQAHLGAKHPFQFGWPAHTAETREQLPAPQARVWISPIQRRFAEGSDFPKVLWHPRVLWVGVGCERGSSKALLAWAIEQTCLKHHLAEAAIAGLATLDLKANEVGLLELCAECDWPLRCFKANQLKDVAVPNPSEVVQRAVGTPSVAEASAILAAGEQGQAGGERREERGESQAFTPRLIAQKQVFRRDDQPGAVTVAIAEAEQEYTGKSGALWLVGTGPGSLEHITPAAKAAIARADAVIGYSLYVDLVRPLLQPGQIIEALPITQEMQRAVRAIELAQWGLSVAVISSGDCGVYGMAGLVLELLAKQGWDGQTPAVEVFPGISALQAAAARIGAPLMHDFCAISLSDLLTPWEIIRQRLEAAAQADFVVALYNPKSKTRTQPIQAAQQIFLAHRPPHTPVALVRSAYRVDEEIAIATVQSFLEHPIDMLTTVLIGNCSSRVYGDRIITPRGYMSMNTSRQ